MTESEPRAEQVELRSASWWMSAILGVLIGVTMTLIRTQRYFFIAGAAILAGVILVLGLRTIYRRSRYPQMAQAKTSWVYAVWTLVLLVLAGPVQLVYLADEFDEIAIKSFVLSVGFCFGFHEVDRAMVESSKKSFAG
ncbi:hypothetical protein [Glutamicibacter arilaitensis]|uniref:hypothetical protein n=1 Tax=Glutamicibacter arilaitensis TaxID=256701 RepID=UPI00384A9869